MAKDSQRPVVDSEHDAKVSRAEKLLAKIHELRANMRNGIGMVAVTGRNPNYVYLWANRDPNWIASRQAQGYEIVGMQDPDVLSDFKNETTGQHIRADLILMRAHRDTVDLLKMMAEMAAIEQIDDPSSALRAFAKQYGLPEDTVFALQGASQK